MNKSSFVKSIATAIVLLILTLGTIGTNALLANADVGGEGKYLEIQFNGAGITVSNCKVIATKISSGQTFIFSAIDSNTYVQKVGAGTVLLEAIPDNGWVFSHWGGDVKPITGNTAEYKTVKYGVVTAYFEKLTYAITAQVSSSASNGHIETIINGESQVIGETPFTVNVERGDSQTFTFHPNTNTDHVSAIQVDDQFEPYALQFQFDNVQENHELQVYFSANGEAYVPAGNNVAIFLGDDVSLSFTSTQGGGTASQAEVILLPSLAGTSLILWNVNAGVQFESTVEIALPYAGSVEIQHVFTGNSLDALYSDVNADGVVNGDDVSDVANAIRTLVPHGTYDATFDIDRNGVLDEEDIHVVNVNKGTKLQELNFRVVGDILYIETGHFSIFRGR